MKYKFLNDYSEGAHPKVLEAFQETNFFQEPGYGNDSFSIKAAGMIKDLAQNQNLDVHFVSGGTQANLLVAAAFLKPFESVIAAASGHIHTHEAGAIEATGHKIETVETPDGKLSPELIDPVLKKFPKYHTVKPRMVYISNTTELGTLYTKKELEILSTFCKDNDLLLFIDGARLAMALTADDNDLCLADISRLTDVFYFGGTKCGALFGEAIVVCNENYKEDFRYHLKQRGAMLAKGRAIGVQFDALLSDKLIFDLADRSNRLAQKIADAFDNLGFKFLTKPQTNQVFPILPKSLITELQKEYEFFVWEEINKEQAAIRLVTSWATDEEVVDTFIKKVSILAGNQ